MEVEGQVSKTQLQRTVHGAFGSEELDVEVGTIGVQALNDNVAWT